MRPLVSFFFATMVMQSSYAPASTGTGTFSQSPTVCETAMEIRANPTTEAIEQKADEALDEILKIAELTSSNPTTAVRALTNVVRPEIARISGLLSNLKADLQSTEGAQTLAELNKNIKEIVRLVEGNQKLSGVKQEQAKAASEKAQRAYARVVELADEINTSRAELTQTNSELNRQIVALRRMLTRLSEQQWEGPMRIVAESLAHEIVGATESLLLLTELSITLQSSLEGQTQIYHKAKKDAEQIHIISQVIHKNFDLSQGFLPPKNFDLTAIAAKEIKVGAKVMTPDGIAKVIRVRDGEVTVQYRSLNQWKYIRSYRFTEVGMLLKGLSAGDVSIGDRVHWPERLFDLRQIGDKEIRSSDMAYSGNATVVALTPTGKPFVRFYRPLVDTWKLPWRLVFGASIFNYPTRDGKELVVLKKVQLNAGEVAALHRINNEGNKDKQ